MKENVPVLHSGNIASKYNIENMLTLRDSLRSHDGRDGKTSRWEHSELTMRADVMHTKRQAFLSLPFGMNLLPEEVRTLINLQIA